MKLKGSALISISFLVMSFSSFATLVYPNQTTLNAPGKLTLKVNTLEAIIPGIGIMRAPAPIPNQIPKIGEWMQAEIYINGGLSVLTCYYSTINARPIDDPTIKFVAHFWDGVEKIPPASVWHSTNSNNFICSPLTRGTREKCDFNLII